MASRSLLPEDEFTRRISVLPEPLPRQRRYVRAGLALLAVIVATLTLTWRCAQSRATHMQDPMEHIIVRPPP